MTHRLLFFIILLFLVNWGVSAQMGIQTNLPEASFDIKSTNNGVLIPRVDLISFTNPLPVTNPQGASLAESTIVYHKGTNNIAAGFYYWGGTEWTIVGPKKNKGLQYYVYNSPTNPANTNRNLVSGLIKSGIYTGNLDDNGRKSIYDNHAYIIFFTGTFEVTTAGDFQIQVITDDGSRVYVDNALVLNTWVTQPPTTFNGTTFTLAKGKHKIEFWYYENQGIQSMIFKWLKNANGVTAGSIIKANEFYVK